MSQPPHDDRDHIEIHVGEAADRAQIVGKQTNLFVRALPLLGLLVVIAAAVVLALIPEGTRFSLFALPTPLAGATAITEGDNREVLLLVAKFDQDENTFDIQHDWADRLEDATDEMTGVRILPIDQMIYSHDEARQISEVYQATLVIWGERFATRIKVNYTAAPQWSAISTLPGENGETQVNMNTVDDLETFVFSSGGDNEYVLNFILGQLYYFNKEYVAALPLLERSIELAPAGREQEMGVSAVYFYAGYIYQTVQKDNTRTITAYTRAIELNPDYALAYYNRGNAYFDQDKLDEAIADYTRALEINPDYADAYWGRGSVYYDLGDYPHAAADYREYERLTGKLELFMEERIAEMEAALTATPPG